MTKKGASYYKTISMHVLPFALERCRYLFMQVIYEADMIGFIQKVDI
jgi:hypothetical protein